MVGKLVSAEFCGKSAVELQVVVDAFCAAFPSLNGLKMKAKVLLDFMYSEGQGRQAGERIEKALDDASYDGEWPGRVFRIMEHDAGHKPRCIELVVQPWVGDRVLRIRDAREAPIWPNWLAIADYSLRPSAVAAGPVIELVELAQQMGGPLTRVSMGELARVEYRRIESEQERYWNVPPPNFLEAILRKWALEEIFQSEEDVCLCLYNAPVWDEAHEAFAEFFELAHELNALGEGVEQTSLRGCEIVARMAELECLFNPKEDE